ncbi:MAG TPA: ATP-grasp domain-containing protein [Candidatus Aphodovivens avistercoris]|nr:ATP-grasp domain-containing protein [Candidatus Aphodovivens avistercoris]
MRIEEFASPFCTVGFGELENGAWTVLETGDGQVSGLATEITPEAFCATLTERLATDVEARSILPPTCI